MISSDVAERVRELKAEPGVLRGTAGSYPGCCYLSPLGFGLHSTTNSRLRVDVSWWVTPDAYNAGLYTQDRRSAPHLDVE